MDIWSRQTTKPKVSVNGLRRDISNKIVLAINTNSSTWEAKSGLLRQISVISCQTKNQMSSQ